MLLPYQCRSEPNKWFIMYKIHVYVLKFCVICRAARQAESLKVVLQSVKELRAVIQPSLASSARQELHAIDAHIQHCESECPSMENYSNMIQAVKAFSKALVSSDPVAKPPLDEETDDPMVACPEERLTFLPRSQIPPTVSSSFDPHKHFKNRKFLLPASKNSSVSLSSLERYYCPE